MMMRILWFSLAFLTANVGAFGVNSFQSRQRTALLNANDLGNSDVEDMGSSSRREAFQSMAAVVGSGLLSAVLPEQAWASGGATAGKYTYVLPSRVCYQSLLAIHCVSIIL